MRMLEDRVRELVGPEDLERLDARVESLVRAAELEARSFDRVRLPLWAVATACLFCTLLGGGVASLLHHDEAVSKPTVLVIETTPELEAWLSTPRRKTVRRIDERQYSSMETKFFAGSRVPAKAVNGSDL